MLITKTSPLTGKVNTMDIDVTQHQYDMWAMGMLIQIAMPNLNAEEREFIVSGCTQEDWDNMFGEDNE